VVLSAVVLHTPAWGQDHPAGSEKISLLLNLPLLLENLSSGIIGC
jgi:hypothetical protein